MGGVEKRPSPRRWILLAAVVLVVAFVLPPLFNINRYQHRIADSIGRSIGRQVHISSVKLRLLPLPGFELADFSGRRRSAFRGRAHASLQQRGGVLAALIVVAGPAGSLPDPFRRRQPEPGPRTQRGLESGFGSGPGCAHPKRPHRPTLCGQRSAIPVYRGRKHAHQFQAG